MRTQQHPDAFFHNVSDVKALLPALKKLTKLFLEAKKLKNDQNQVELFRRKVNDCANAIPTNLLDELLHINMIGSTLGRKSGHSDGRDG